MIGGGRYNPSMPLTHEQIDRAAIPSEWLAEFEAAARRPLAQRWRYAFIRTHKPVLDDGPGFRAFDTTADYRRWCEQSLPRFLGFHRGV
jgi:hypothetical protein